MNGLRLVPARDITSWVNLWAGCYESPEEDEKYLRALNNLHNAHDEEGIQAALLCAFEWKNGGRLSEAKKAKVRQIDLERWNDWTQLQDPPRHFSGAVWNIFLLHLRTGGQRSIFDQHCWRSYCFLQRRDCLELEEATVEEIFSFYREYDAWFAGCVRNGIDSRQLDRAQMAFGQFLKSQFKPLLGIE